MCCCKVDEDHNEAMKFRVKCEEENRHMLDEPIFFPNKAHGRVKDDSEDVSNRIKIPKLIDSSQVFGRNMEVFKIVRFLVSEDEKDKRVLNLHGIRSVEESGAFSIAQ